MKDDAVVVGGGRKCEGGTDEFNYDTEPRPHSLGHRMISLLCKFRRSSMIQIPSTTTSKPEAVLVTIRLNTMLDLRIELDCDLRRIHVKGSANGKIFRL